jgi:hypothetical protein
MRIRMLKTVRGSPDGFTVREYVVGEVVDLGDGREADLADAFLRGGFAEAAEIRALPEAAIAKDPAPETAVSGETAATADGRAPAATRTPPGGKHRR